jgi:dTDP-4-amino-4,6-dideoxygalactose transaminase
MKIPFNRQYINGLEDNHIQEAIKNGFLSGNGPFTKKCQSWLENRYSFHKAMLTSSCTDALEMAALLLDVQPGDEIIMPSYTFVSTANAFVLRGATVIFADSRIDHPGIDETHIEALINSRTKAIVVVHYAGVACDMDAIMNIATRHRLKVIEDAAQAIDCFYKGKPLGGIGHLGAFSFHATKNIHCGEGGALIINDPSLVNRAEILWEHGTNRASFLRGEVTHYQWCEVGSSFLPSELNAAFLWGQLQSLTAVTKERCRLSELYTTRLASFFELNMLYAPSIPIYSKHNGHINYVVCQSMQQRDDLIKHLKNAGIQACSHYQPLHSSYYYKAHQKNQHLINCERYGSCLLRLPIFVGLKDKEVIKICEEIGSFFQN